METESSSISAATAAGADACQMLDPQQFRAVFPFFVSWTSSLAIRDCGPSLGKICLDARPGRPFDDVFALERPVTVLAAGLLPPHRGQLFLFRHRASGLLFRGQLILATEEQGGGLLLASPWFTTAEEVAACGLSYKDFAVHDPVFDMLLLLQAQKTTIAELRQLNGILTEQRARLGDINARLVEQEKESRKLALLAARTDNAVVVTDRNGLTEWVNEAFVRISGYTLEEMRGRKPGEILQGPRTDPRTVQRIREALAHEESITTDILNYRKDGSSYWLSIGIQPIRDSQGNLTNYMAVQRNVSFERSETRRHQINHAASRVFASAQSIEDASRELIAGLCEHLGGQVGLVWMKTPDDGLMHCVIRHSTNDRTAPVFAGEAVSPAPKHCDSLPGRVMTTGNLIHTTTPPAWPGDPPDGSSHALAFPIISDHAVLGVFEVRADFLEAPNPEMTSCLLRLGQQMGQFIARRKAEERLQIAKDIAEKANAIKSAFLATMSHEIRTPLNGIIGFTEILGETPLTPLQLDHLQTIRRSGEILREIVDNVLDLARLESGGIELDVLDFEPRILLQETMDVHEPAVRSKGLRCTWEIDPEVPEIVRGDMGRLRQVLLNVVSNAVKFTMHGTVGVRVTTTGGRLCFEVRDTGIGFDPAIAAQLFEPFRQADPSTARKFGGAGLGLAICRELVNLMGGGIHAVSEPGEGAVFTFWIPLVVPDRVPTRHGPTPPGPSQAPATPPPSPGAALSILIAEDNPVNAELLTLILQGKGFNTSVAETGAEVIRMLAQNPEISAVIMDLRMPDMGGLEATRRLRSGEAGEIGRTIPVIALTASALPEVRDECLTAGMNAYLTKPIRPDALLGALQAAGLGAGSHAPAHST